jgi:ATP-binding cassette subfamily B multidrug efflux pump
MNPRLRKELTSMPNNNTHNTSSPRPSNQPSGGAFRGPGPGGMHGPGAGFGPVQKAKDTRGTLRRLWKYLSKKSFLLFSIFILVLLSNIPFITGPYLIKIAIDSYIIPGNLKGLLVLCIFLLLIYFFGVFTTWLYNYLMVDLAQDTVKDMRNDLFTKLQALPLQFFDSKTHGELMSRITNDIDNINNSLSMSVTSIFSSISMVLGVLVFMIVLSPLLTLISLIVVPLMIFSTGAIAKRTRLFFLSNQEKLGKLNGFIEETITGQRAVKVFTHEAKALENFTVFNKELRDVGIQAQVFSGIIPPLMNVLNNLSFAIVAGAGGWMVVIKLISVGTIAAFINYSKQFTRPLSEIANQFNTIQSGIAGAERVFQIIDQTPELPDSDDAIELKQIKGEVVFKDVTFGYKEENPVLKKINLVAKPGQTIALVGPTGAGKTTIVNLLMRFYDINQGAIYIDGTKIQSVKRDSLRCSMGIVLQDTHLFSESVKENIRFGNLGATDEEVIAAAKMANADHFIRSLPQGYDTILSEDGGNLSQGQRQLLSIARTILADPAILILDEATSSVDTRTEAHIQEAMLNLMKGRTSFVIAHRLSTIRNADSIIIINQGEIVEQGTHEELIEKKGLYYNLYMNMFRK